MKIDVPRTRALLRVFDFGRLFNRFSALRERDFFELSRPVRARSVTGPLWEYEQGHLF